MKILLDSEFIYTQLLSMPTKKQALFFSTFVLSTKFIHFKGWIKKMSSISYKNLLNYIKSIIAVNYIFGEKISDYKV